MHVWLDTDCYRGVHPSGIVQDLDIDQALSWGSLLCHDGLKGVGSKGGIQVIT